MRFGADRKLFIVVAMALLTVVSSACAQSKEQSKEAKMKEIQAQVEKARDLRFKGDNEGALREQLKAVELDQNYDQTWLLLASVYMDLERWNKAEEAVKKAIELNKNEPDTHQLYGSILERLGRKEESLVQRQEAVNLSPENPFYLVNLGLSFDLINNKEAARDSFLQALRVNPDYAYANYQLADLEADEGNLLRAIELFERTASLKPTNDYETSDDQYFIDDAKVRAAELKEKLKKKKS